MLPDVGGFFHDFSAIFLWTTFSARVAIPNQVRRQAGAGAGNKRAPRYNGAMSKQRPRYVQPYRYASSNIPLSAIKRFARQIAEQFHPDKILLFGSYASRYGNMQDIRFDP
jgi:hypothetical protein